MTGRRAIADPCPPHDYVRAWLRKRPPGRLIKSLAHGPAEGQETDPPEPRERCSALRLTEPEARALKAAIRKVAATRRNGYIALAAKIGIPPSTLYHAMRPGGRPSPGLAIRFAAVVGVPVEVVLGGKVVVAPAIVGVAA